jgi:hypothetical protein
LYGRGGVLKGTVEGYWDDQESASLIKHERPHNWAKFVNLTSCFKRIFFKSLLILLFSPNWGPSVSFSFEDLWPIKLLIM